MKDPGKLQTYQTYTARAAESIEATVMFFNLSIFSICKLNYNLNKRLSGLILDFRRVMFDYCVVYDTFEE